MDVDQSVARSSSHGSIEAPRKLHLGCGKHVLDEWVNTDIEPQDNRVHPLDVTKRFPVRTGSVDFIFSEHMIEHLTYQDGEQMLAECYRTLRPGGRIRITTPDLQFLIRLFDQKLDELQKTYLSWSSSTFCGRPASDHPVFVLNNFVRAWGHRFIYDPSSLGNLMRKTGFADIQQHDLMASSHQDLRNLENISRLPPGYLQLESFTLEGCKPS